MLAAAVSKVFISLTYLKQAFPKRNASEGILAYVAVSKYQDALPLYRLENIFKRAEVHSPRNTMANKVSHGFFDYVPTRPSAGHTLVENLMTC